MWYNKAMEKTKQEINNLIALRNIYFSIVVVLSGGLVGLFYNPSTLNLILFVVGMTLDFIYLSTAYKTSKKITLLINRLE